MSTDPSQTPASQSPVPESFLREIGYDKDGFEGGPHTEWILANREAVCHAIMMALERVLYQVSCIEFSEARVETTTNTGILMRLTHEDWCRGHKVDSTTRDIPLSWTELLDYNTHVGSLVEDRFNALQDAERAAKEAADRREREEQAKRAAAYRESQERAEYERLRAKYEGGTTP